MAKTSLLSTYLKEIVYGGNDGIVTTFAVVAGFAGAQSHITSIPLLSVLLFGFANLFADGVSMALGNFLSNRSQKDVYKQQKKRELSEITNDLQSEEEETRTILVAKGFSTEQAETLLSIYKTNTPYWLSFMMNDELEMPNPERENDVLQSFVTLSSFILFGLIPLLPYVFARQSPNIFIYSFIATFSALVLLGIFRWKVTQQQFVRSMIETLFLGGLAALVAYSVGSLFRV